MDDHKSSLARAGITTEGATNGNEAYSKEKLVAGMGAAVLYGVAGIDNSASYIDSWIRALKKDYHIVLKAASQAQKASDYILGAIWEKDS
ncbi:zincin-like metallopeptidase domain-containing protein [Metabacillus idriensis]|uniref:zincin-like metallopeptidase domain-containing protein n=1 Tax=Metabacillus idriensis TaxID=324768 RepID=UPI001CD3E671|nr:zincin-like metallopeptidase domain-containing protein [Metabacillus idriensis]